MIMKRLNLTDSYNNILMNNYGLPIMGENGHLIGYKFEEDCGFDGKRGPGCPVPLSELSVGMIRCFSGIWHVQFVQYLFRRDVDFFRIRVLAK